MEELVERAKNEDSDAFNNLILNIEKDLYCIARSKIDNENDIEDIIQETMIIAFLNIKKLKKRKRDDLANLSPFLIYIIYMPLESKT